MINDGVLDNPYYGPVVDAIYGIHLWSCELLLLSVLLHNINCCAVYKFGDVGCQEGPIMAASDKFTIDVLGKGGHGAAPQGTVDAIVEAASLVTALQTIVSRNKV